MQIAVDRPVPKPSRARRARSAGQDQPNPAFDQALSHAESSRPKEPAAKPASPEPPTPTQTKPEAAAEPENVEQTSDAAVASAVQPSAAPAEATETNAQHAAPSAAPATAVGLELPGVATPPVVAETAEESEQTRSSRPVVVPEGMPAARPTPKPAGAVTARPAAPPEGKPVADADAKATRGEEPAGAPVLAKPAPQEPQAQASIVERGASDVPRATIEVTSSIGPAEAQLSVSPGTKEQRSEQHSAGHRPDTSAREPLAAQAPPPATDLPLPAAHQANTDLPSVEVSMLAPQPHAPATPPSPAQAAQPLPITPQRFAEVNHPQIVRAIRGELVPGGGTMHIRLDPPELGPLQVTVRMDDGVMTASFQTSSDQATQLLSHSLTQLKHVLESQGVTVEKLQVQQAPRDADARGSDDPRQQREQHPDDHPARQEQQRRELLRRMWRRLAIGQDPLDLVA
jgi:flagellar hook-length control protein FliK